MISQSTIDRIFEAVNIEEVVSDFVKLRRSGSNLSGLCPFHTEKTPSFSVSPRKNIYKCFGCGLGGNSVDFVMRKTGKNYPEALRYLADKYNIFIEEEKPDPEAEKKQQVKIKLSDFNRKVSEQYQAQLYLPENKKALDYVLGRWDENTVKQWMIGYAPAGFTRLYDWAKNQGLDDVFLLSTGLVKRSGKNQKVYDFFQDRIMFPVLDARDNIISFSGRTLPGSQQKAKYMNLSDTSAYNKGHVLYGMNQALASIIKTKTAVLVEGNPDVVKMHEIGITTTVAASGTSLTDDQIRLLQRYAEKIVMLYDGDGAGEKAMLKNASLVVQKGTVPYVAILPENEDPDTFFKSEEQFNEWTEANQRDFINHYASSLFNKAGTDPGLKNEAINRLCDLIVHLSATQQQLYIDTFARESKIKGKLFQDRLKELEAQNVKPDDTSHNLPEDVDPNEFEKWGFYIYKNAYYFRSKGGIEKLSNFVMKPVFHIDSMADSKRIYELVNEHGYKVVVNLDMNEMTSLQGFQRNVESKGNFMFLGQMSNFQRLKLKLYEETRTCIEIKNLGWQREGFWAWANGMTDSDGNFQEVDEYGIVRHEDQDYFIPAFSRIYLADKSIFLDERKFQYRPGKVSLENWMNLYLKVHGNNAMVAFAWYLSAIFRDHILYLNDNFPLLNLFGQKGSGKNTLAYSLLSLFGKRQTEYNLHNGTKPGLAKHLEMFRNAIAFTDEYKNNLPFDMIETLKSIYNAIGRSRLNMDKGGKKETTEVNQGVIVAGQEMPTIDVALSTRMIYLQFLTKEGLSKEAKSNFENLQLLERDGLPHFTVEFLGSRKFFTENYKINYDAVMRDINSATGGEDINDRILRNMATVVASFKTLEPRFKFTFSYSDLLNHSIEVMRIHNRQIKQSDEIGIFWSLIEAMFDDDILIEKWHFHVKMVTSITLKNEQKKEFPDGLRVLKFKFNAVAKLYAEHLRRRGEKPLPQDSLQHYLQTNKYFIGIEKACKFQRKEYKQGVGIVEQKQTTTAFCFDYEQIGINLERNLETDNPYNNYYNEGNDNPAPDPAPTEAERYHQTEINYQTPF